MKERREPDKKVQRYVHWYSARLRGWSEDAILRNLEQSGLGGFRTLATLYLQLANDGFPVCAVCGETPTVSGHCEKPRKKRQPDLGSGHKVKLPDAVAAHPLFRKALRELDERLLLVGAEEGWLEGYTEDGEFKGKHFVTQFVDREDTEVTRREDFNTDEAWKKMCERLGVDTESEETLTSVGSATAGGVGRAPSDGLTSLIAVYALAGLPLTSLVEALHRRPDAARWEELNANLDELRKVAQHLAIRVRGGIVGRGRGVEEVSREDHFAAWLVRRLEEEGATSDEEIHKRLKDTFPSWAERLSPEEISRVKRLGLTPPE